MKSDAGTRAPRGLLIDFTRCIGCDACRLACREANGLGAPAPDAPPPEDLGASELTVVLAREVGGQAVHVRRLCMHCADPACVSACPLGALKKRADGPVVYDPDLCFGCRYCMTACPFQVPRYNWDSPAPVIHKCTLCYPRLDEGREPACAAVCPTGATRYGPRELLLRIARERLRSHPARYTDHVYGEHEVGGTDVLMLAPADFAALGFPAGLPRRALPALTWAVQKRIPNVLATGAVLLGGVWWIIHRRVQLAERPAAAADARGAVARRQGDS